MKKNITKSKTIIYVVGDHGPEHNSIISIHRTKEGALNAFQEHRKYLLESAKDSLERCKKRSDDEFMVEIYEREVKNLKEEDPEKIDNYPQETPYLHKKELKD